MAPSGDALAHHVGRQRLGDAVGDGEPVVEHAGGVLDRGLGLEPAEGGDLGDPVGAVLLGDVGDHLAAAVVVEVDVEVGHRRALGVEEALEEQSVLERAQVGDAQGVGRDRAGAGPRPGPTRMPLSLDHWMKSATTR